MCSVWTLRSITCATLWPQRRTPAGGRASRRARVGRAQRRAADFFFVDDFFVVTAFFLEDVDFFALAFDFEELDARALAFDLLLPRDACADDFPRRLRAERERAECSGRFQPTARSARNDAGMLRMP